MTADGVTRIEFVAAGIFVLIVFVVASRFIARFVSSQLHRRNLRGDMVVLGRRVVYVLVIGFGLLAALSLATETANVTLVGILLATLIAALGVQDLLRDYVSGYYILFERHFRIGDRIGFDSLIGTVMDVRLRVTLLRGDAGDLIVVPNSELFNKSVTVYTKKAEEEVAKPAPPG